MRPAGPSEASLARVQRLLSDADRPLVIAGNGAVRANAAAELRRFVEATDVPVASTYMGKGAVSDADPRSLMTLDSGDHDEAATAIGDADLVLAVGYDIAEYDPESWNPDGEKDVIHLDFEPAEVFFHYNPEVELVGDVASGIAQLDERLSNRDINFDTDWYTQYRERIREDIASYTLQSGDDLTIPGVLNELRDTMNPEDLIISDVGSHKMSIAQNFPTYEPNTCIISNGLAAMGIAVPGGIAADLAVDSNVVAATGDGGFLMNAAELETATRVGCAFTVVVFVDDDYGLISAKQRDHRGESFGTGLTNPDFVAFAESFGVEARRPETAEDLVDDERARSAERHDEVDLVVTGLAAFGGISVSD